MNGEQKITPEHQSRRAIVYLRQSSEGQVRNNIESQRLQYAMAHQARDLGFGQVEVIDVDLGASAAVAAKRREGFERILAAVALKEVGLILSRELSRLLRTDKDFCQLLELCQLFGTLVGDEYTIYDLSRMDDQLVLGIRATMSVAELNVLRMRLSEGKENKAKRGEIYPRLPPGYVWGAPGHVIKDPNLRVQEAIELVFAKFRETWSIRQTFKWFRDNDVELPVSQAREGKLVVAFQCPRHTFIAGVLHNPWCANFGNPTIESLTFLRNRRMTELARIRLRTRRHPQRLCFSVCLAFVASACGGTGSGSDGGSGGSGGSAASSTGGSAASAASGGASSGGSFATTSGGVGTSGGATGGAAAGGASPGTGGRPMAGGPSGGAATGGTSVGGAATGGATTGGSAVGGAATGGASSAGGVSTGGVTTGGSVSTGGTSSGGSEASGGSPGSGGTEVTGGSGDTGGMPGSGGGTSECGPSTLNPNPFGCEFAWGQGDPPGSLDGFGFLDFATFWIDWGIGADGSLSGCNGCTWLTNKVAATDLVPVYYAYVIGYFAHANGVVDGNQCPADNPDCPNLTNDGAALLRAHRDTLVGIYADYARQSYAVWPTRPLVWLLEGDYIQFAAESQSEPFTLDELADLAGDITCAIKGNMPNAVVGINHSTWNLNEETDAFWAAMNARVNYDIAWTTGVANNNGYFNADVNASSYNGATATYAYLHSVSGKPIFVDDGCGNTAAEAWSTSSASELNELIAAGVMAFNDCDGVSGSFASLVEALRPQLNSTCN